MEILSNKLLTTAFEASLGKEYPNLFLLDIICHGTPSPKLFEEMEKKYAADIKVSFPRKAVRIIKRTIKKILRGRLS